MNWHGKLVYAAHQRCHRTMRAPEHCRAALLGALLSVMLVMVAGQAWPATRSPPPPGCGKLGAACCCAGAGTSAHSSCLACVLALSTAHRWWQHNTYHPKFCWTSITALMFVNAGWCSAGDATSQLSPVPPLPTCWPQLWTGKMLPAAVRASSVDGFLAQDLAHCRSRHRCVCRVLQQPAPPHQSR